MIDPIRNRDVRALSRAATSIENRTAMGRALVHELRPHAGRAAVVGITGPAGAGKSTLISQLVGHLRREGQRVAVISIDPSSAVTHGALLGDRIRMQTFAGDPDVFIRSVATRGAAGGIAEATADLVLLFDAAGFDTVVVETVGVGQSEIAVSEIAQVTVVVLAPGFGDDVQAIKAGLLEMADVFAVNKADLPGADRLIADLEAVRSFTADPGRADRAPICRLVATEGIGIRELWNAIASAGRTERPRKAGGVEIDHLGIAVNSIQEALALYQDVLGCPVSSTETVEQERVRVAMLPAAHQRIELLEATDPDSPIARFLDRRGPGLHHIALRVDDLPSTVRKLKARGAELLNEPRVGAGGHIYVFVHPRSTGGVLLELIQK